MKLFTRIAGNGPPLVILHGLFGSSDNWHTLAKLFAQSHTVYTVDQRNHGQSPHSDEMNYTLLTEDLRELLQDQGLKQAIILGHSMGGKTAMNFAVKYPGMTEKLIVVDIAPRAYVMRHDSLVAGMKAIPLDTVKSRQEAEALLTPYASDASERQFILKNLERRPDGGFDWKINLKALDEHMDDLGHGLEFPGTYAGEALFIRGSKSDYFRDGDETEIRKIFPKAVFETLDTGHWVQAEKPQEFLQAVMKFLNS